MLLSWFCVKLHKKTIRFLLVSLLDDHVCVCVVFDELLLSKVEFSDIARSRVKCYWLKSVEEKESLCQIYYHWSFSPGCLLQLVIGTSSWFATWPLCVQTEFDLIGHTTATCMLHVMFEQRPDGGVAGSTLALHLKHNLWLSIARTAIILAFMSVSKLGKSGKTTCPTSSISCTVESSLVRVRNFWMHILLPERCLVNNFYPL